MTFDEAKVILAAFEQEGVSYVLVGSMGMAAQDLIRGTRNLDFFVSPEAANVDRLKRMKKDTVRPQDRIDAEWIRRSFDLREE